MARYKVSNKNIYGFKDNLYQSEWNVIANKAHVI